MRPPELSGTLYEVAYANKKWKAMEAYAIEQTRAQGHSAYGDGCVPVFETLERLKMEVMYCIGTSAPTVRRAGQAYPGVCTQAYALTDARQPSNIICRV